MREYLGKVYTDILYESGITVLESRVITSLEFGRELRRYQVPARSTRNILKSLSGSEAVDSVLFCYRNIAQSRKKEKRDGKAVTTFPGFTLLLESLNLEEGPREHVGKVQLGIREFMDLPESAKSIIYGFDRADQYLDGIAELPELVREKRDGQYTEAQLRDIIRGIETPEAKRLTIRIIATFNQNYPELEIVMGMLGRKLKGDPEEIEQMLGEFLEFNVKEIPGKWAQGEVSEKAVTERLEKLALRR